MLWMRSRPRETRSGLFSATMAVHVTAGRVVSGCCAVRRTWKPADSISRISFPRGIDVKLHDLLPTQRNHPPTSPPNDRHGQAEAGYDSAAVEFVLAGEGSRFGSARLPDVDSLAVGPDHPDQAHTAVDPAAGLVVQVLVTELAG